MEPLPEEVDGQISSPSGKGSLLVFIVQASSGPLSGEMLLKYIEVKYTAFGISFNSLVKTF